MTKAIKKVTFARPERRRAGDAVREDVFVNPSPAGTPPGRAAHARATPPPSIEGVGAGVGAAARARTRTHAKGDSVEDLLAASAQLTEKQRKELLDRLALAQRSSSSGDERDVDMWAGAVHEALSRRVAGALPGPMVVKQQVGAARAWEPVRDFMAASRLQTLTVPERRSVYGLLARLVVKDAEDFCDWADAPLGPKVVAQRCAHVAETFNRSFPGYLRAGLALLVAKRLTGAAA